MLPPSSLLTDDEVVVAVRALFRDAGLQVLNWRAEAVEWQVVSNVTDGLCRLRGLAHQNGVNLPWSLIVKISRPAGGTGEEWQREWRAYTSGLLRSAEGVRPARLLHVTWPVPGRLLLWLEDVPDDTPEVWPLERHVLFAQHLGRFNAAHPLEGGAAPWLWHGWLDSLNPRHYPASTALAFQQAIWDDPLVRTAFPEPCAALLARVNGAFGRWSVRLTALPQTLVHLDAGRFNVRAVTVEGRAHSVLLDWQALGVGPLGTDLAMTHFLNICRFYADPDETAALDAQGFGAYWAAVRAAGAQVERAEVRFAYTAVAAMRASAVIQLLLARLVPPAVDLRLWAEWGRKRGWSEHKALRAWGQGLSALLSLAPEADDLVLSR